jgi:high-affinity iron transporter
MRAIIWSWRTARALPILLLTLAIALGDGSISHAATPAEELAELLKDADAAAALLQSGDLAGARAAYKRFDDGWFDIEDGIRAQSRSSYRAIEDAMGDVKDALRREPIDREHAAAMLAKLRAECQTFINDHGGAAAPPQPAEASATQGDLAAVVARLDRAIAAIDANNLAVAASEVGDFRREWTDVEGLVKVRSGQVYTDTENGMARAYALLTQPEPNPVEARATLAKMKADLQPIAEAPARYGVFDSAIIILREGFEALLIIGALLAFLKKTNNAKFARWIWIGGGLGVLASFVVAALVNVIFSRAAAGANRELLEGVTGLFAAAMLLYMSYWLHSKSSLAEWQRFIGERTSAAIARNSLFSLALIAFLAVFREGAETVLFYIGILPSIEIGELALGLGVGGAGLAVLSVLMFVVGVRLPLRPFFLVMGALIYFMAFKFVGMGIHALQVAGTVAATPAPLPDNGYLGVFPTVETWAAQGVLLAVALGVLLWGKVRSTGQHEDLPSAAPVR